ncbi:hypothetical protein ASPZODRAFT_146525 [Penicilliopsis zonata CBS 506.65]|uniref:C6 transcription factor n=1 Tax=Penicilliopsis zonata CBS 506.65 TaxID=1073090 RepID=A0A1L9S717_9EURO|nr:hypothetical protein ASPZODRAFT_146525 [Penicilliopsis zonata CBS 506.65]OJJ42957.1 hypothetical protein ASPZODRAFT_146525 [Penicilliopsis zonata CBS 506.65]
MWTEPLDPSTRVFRSQRPRKRPRTSCSSSGSALSEESPSSPILSSQGYKSVDSNEIPGSPDESSFQTDERIETEDRGVLNLKTYRDARRALVPGSEPSRHISHLTTLETHYLQYHTETASRLIANLENDGNPLRALLVPRAMSSPLLLRALCALSAIHLSNRAQEAQRAQAAAVKYYVQTLGGIRAVLTDSPTKIFSEDIVLAVALVCKYEIVRGSVKQWTMHFNALQKLIINRGGFATLNRDVADFLAGFIKYAENMARITIPTHQIVGSADDLKVTKLDIYMGYTEEIIEICAEIAKLHSLHDHSELLSKVIKVDTALRHWTYMSRPYIIPGGCTGERISRLRMVADCFRDAAYLYLHATLKRQADRAPFSAVVSVSAQEALQRLLSRVRQTRLDANCEYSALTFPLFIAGSESETRSDRDLVGQSLDNLRDHFGIGNVTRAKQLLGILWETGTKNWLDMLEELQWELNLA